MSYYVYVSEVYGTFSTYICVIPDFTPRLLIHLFSILVESFFCVRQWGRDLGYKDKDNIITTMSELKTKLLGGLRHKK